MRKNNFILWISLTILVSSGCPSSPPPVDTPPEVPSEESTQQSSKTIDDSAAPSSKVEDQPSDWSKETVSSTSSRASSSSPSTGDQPTQPSADEAGKSAAKALSQAQTLYEKSKSKSQRGDHTGAFLDARDAWKLAKGIDGDAAITLTTQIYAHLDRLAQRASKENSPTRLDTSLPLILK